MSDEEDILERLENSSDGSDDDDVDSGKHFSQLFDVIERSDLDGDVKDDFILQPVEFDHAPILGLEAAAGLGAETEMVPVDFEIKSDQQRYDQSQHDEFNDVIRHRPTVETIHALSTRAPPELAEQAIAEICKLGITWCKPENVFISEPVGDNPHIPSHWKSDELHSVEREEYQADPTGPCDELLARLVNSDMQSVQTRAYTWTVPETSSVGNTQNSVCDTNSPPSENCHLALLVGCLHSTSIVQSKVSSFNEELDNICELINTTPEITIPITAFPADQNFSSGKTDVYKHPDYLTFRVKYGLNKEEVERLPRLKAHKNQVKPDQKSKKDDGGTAEISEYGWRIWESWYFAGTYIIRPRRIRPIPIPQGKPVPPIRWVAYNNHRVCPYNNELYEPVTFPMSETLRIPYRAELYTFPCLDLRLQTPGKNGVSLRVMVQIPLRPILLMSVPVATGTKASHTTYDEYDLVGCVDNSVGKDKKRSKDELITMGMDPELPDGHMCLHGPRFSIINQQTKASGKTNRRLVKKSKREIVQSVHRTGAYKRYDMSRMWNGDMASTAQGARRKAFHTVRTMARKAKKEKQKTTKATHKQSIPQNLLAPNDNEIPNNNTISNTLLSASDTTTASGTKCNKRKQKPSNNAASKSGEKKKKSDDTDTPIPRKNPTRKRKNSDHGDTKDNVVAKITKPKNPDNDDNDVSVNVTKRRDSDNDDNDTPVSRKSVRFSDEISKRISKQDMDDDDQQSPRRGKTKRKKTPSDRERETSPEPVDQKQQEEQEDEQDQDDGEGDHWKRALTDAEEAMDTHVDEFEEAADLSMQQERNSEIEKLEATVREARDVLDVMISPSAELSIAAPETNETVSDGVMVDEKSLAINKTVKKTGTKSSASDATDADGGFTLHVSREQKMYRPLLADDTTTVKRKVSGTKRQKVGHKNKGDKNKNSDDDEGVENENGQDANDDEHDTLVSTGKPIPFSLENEIGYQAAKLRDQFDVYSWNTARVLAEQPSLTTKTDSELSKWKQTYSKMMDQMVEKHIANTPSIKQFIYISEYIRWCIPLVFRAFGVVDPEEMREWLLFGIDRYPFVRMLCNKIVDDMVSHDEGITTRRQALIQIGGVWLSKRKGKVEDDDYLAEQGLFYLRNRFFVNATAKDDRSGLEQKFAKFVFEARLIIKFVAHLLDESDPLSFVFRSVITFGAVLNHNFTQSWRGIRSLLEKKFRDSGALVFSPIIPLSHWFIPDIQREMTISLCKFQTARSNVKMAAEKSESKQPVVSGNMYQTVSQFQKHVNRVNRHTGGTARQPDSSLTHGFSSPHHKPTGKTSGFVQHMAMTSTISNDIPWIVMQYLRNWLGQHMAVSPLIDAWHVNFSGPRYGPFSDEDGPSPELMVRPISKEPIVNEMWIISIDDIPYFSTKNPENIWRDLWRLKCLPELQQMGVVSDEIRGLINLSTRGGRPLRPVMVAGICPPLRMTNKRSLLHVPSDVANFWNTIQYLERIRSPILSMLYSTEAGRKICTYMYQRMVDTGAIVFVDPEFLLYSYIAETGRDLYQHPLTNPKTYSTSINEKKKGEMDHVYALSLVNTTCSLRARDLPDGGRAHDMCEIHPQSNQSYTDAQTAVEHTPTTRIIAACSLTNQAVAGPPPDVFVSRLKHIETLHYPETALAYNIVNDRLAYSERPFHMNATFVTSTVYHNTVEDGSTQTQIAKDNGLFRGTCHRTYTKTAYITRTAIKNQKRKDLSAGRENVYSGNVWSKGVSKETYQLPMSEIDRSVPLTIEQYDSIRDSFRDAVDRIQTIDPRDNTTYMNETLRTRDSFHAGITWDESVNRRIKRRIEKKRAEQRMILARAEARLKIREILYQTPELQGIDDEKRDQDNQEDNEKKEQAEEYLQRDDDELELEDPYDPLASSSSDEEVVTLQSKRQQQRIAQQHQTDKNNSPSQFDLTVDATLDMFTRHNEAQRQAKKQQQAHQGLTDEEIQTYLNERYHSLMNKTATGHVSSITMAQSEPGVAHVNIRTSPERGNELADKFSTEGGQKSTKSEDVATAVMICDADGTPITYVSNPHGEASRNTTGRHLQVAAFNLAVQSPDLVLGTVGRPISQMSSFQSKYVDPKHASVGHENYDTTLELPQTLVQMETLHHARSADNTWKTHMAARSLAKKIVQDVGMFVDAPYVQCITAILSASAREACNCLAEEGWRRIVTTIDSPESLYQFTDFFAQHWGRTMLNELEFWERVWPEETETEVVLFRLLIQNMDIFLPRLQQQLINEFMVYQLIAAETDIAQVRELSWYLLVLRNALSLSPGILCQPCILNTRRIENMSDEEVEVHKRRLVKNSKIRVFSNIKGDYLPGTRQVGFAAIIRPTKFADHYLGQLKISAPNPPRDHITMQPTKNRDQDGASQYNYMEKLCLELNNAHELYHERTMHSAPCVRPVCTKCGLIAIEIDLGTGETQKHCNPCNTGEFVVRVLMDEWLKNEQQHNLLANNRFRIVPDLSEPVTVPIHINSTPRPKPPLAISQ